MKFLLAVAALGLVTGTYLTLLRRVTPSIRRSSLIHGLALASLAILPLLLSSLLASGTPLGMAGKWMLTAPWEAWLLWVMLAAAFGFGALLGRLLDRLRLGARYERPAQAARATSRQGRPHFRILLAAVIGAVVFPSAFVAPGMAAECVGTDTTHCWTGGALTDPNWDNSLNWTGGRPSDGAVLEFPAGASQKGTSFNNINGLTLKSLKFTDGGYTIGGKGVSLNPDNQLGIDTTSTSGTNTINLLTLTLNTGQDFDVAGTATAGELVINSQIGGSSEIGKTGGGTLTLSGSNIYDAPTTVWAGKLRIQNASALGTAAEGKGTTVQLGGTLEISGGITSGEPLTLNGTGVSSTGALRNGPTGNNTWRGPVTLASSSSIGGASGTLTISGEIKGPSTATLTKVGAGTLVLPGPNTYEGATTIGSSSATGGVLRVLRASALGSGEVTVNSGGSGSTLDIEGEGLEINRSLTLNGAGFSGTGAIRNVTGNNTWMGPMSLVSNSTIAVDGESLTFSAAIGPSSARDLTKIGAGTLKLSGSSSNTYTGATIVNAGVLELAKSSGNDAIAGNLTVGDGTGDDRVILLSENQIIDDKAVTLNSSGLLHLNGLNDTIGTLTLNAGSVTTGTGTLTLGGNVTASGASSISGKLSVGTGRTFTVSSSGTLAVPASVSGSGGIAKEGAGTLVLAGDNADLSGTVAVNTGVLKIQHSKALGTVSAGTSVGSGAALQVEGGITLNEPLIIEGTGVTSTGALRSVNGNNILGGQITLNADSAVGADTDTLTTSGVIGQSTGTTRGLTKVGDGKVVLTANNTYTGTTTVNAGTLLVNGSQGSSNVSLTGGILGGTGTVGSITATGGIVSPGTSPGILNSGSVTFNSAMAFSVELNGTVAGSGYDQLNVTGTVTPGDAVLSVSMGFQPDVGTQFRIINNDGTDSVTGSFADLAEGSSFVFDDQLFTITYQGGDGNDVVLTRSKADTETTLASSPNPSKFGQSVTFTASVSVTPPGSGTPTGTVTFKDGQTTLGTGDLDSSGQATFTTSALSVGSHSITAEYGGDSNFNGSTSAALAQTVEKADTEVSLASSPNPSTSGQSVTFTATVSAASGAGSPTGTVTFKDGATTLGTGTLDSSGKATLTTSTLAVGSHSITAEYGRSSSFNPSTSAVLTQTVEKDALQHPDGTLIKGSSPTVYYLEAGRKRHVPNAAVFESRFRWSEIVSVLDSELTLYPDGATLGFRDGTLIGIPDGRVWAISNEARRHITSESVFVALGYAWSNVRWVSFGEGAVNPDGEPIHSYTGTHPDGTLMKGSGSAVYYLEASRRRHVSSAAVFESWFGWNEIVGISDSELAIYADGGSMGFRDGTLIHTPDGRVWAISSGQRRHIVSEGAFNSLGYSWSNLRYVSDAEGSLHPVGPSIG